MHVTNRPQGTFAKILALNSLGVVRSIALGLAEL